MFRKRARKAYGNNKWGSKKELPSILCTGKSLKLPSTKETKKQNPREQPKDIKKQTLLSTLVVQKASNKSLQQQQQMTINKMPQVWHGQLQQKQKQQQQERGRQEKEVRRMQGSPGLLCTQTLVLLLVWVSLQATSMGVMYRQVWNGQLKQQEQQRQQLQQQQQQQEKTRKVGSSSNNVHLLLLYSSSQQKTLVLLCFALLGLALVLLLDMIFSTLGFLLQLPICHHQILSFIFLISFATFFTQPW